MNLENCCQVYSWSRFFDSPRNQFCCPTNSFFPIPSHCIYLRCGFALIFHFIIRFSADLRRNAKMRQTCAFSINLPVCDGVLFMKFFFVCYRRYCLTYLTIDGTQFSYAETTCRQPHACSTGSSRERRAELLMRMLGRLEIAKG